MTDTASELLVVLRLVNRQAERVSTHPLWNEYAAANPAAAEEYAWVTGNARRLAALPAAETTRERVVEADGLLDSISRVVAALFAYARAAELRAALQKAH